MPLGDSYPGRCRSFDPLPAGRTRPLPMLAEAVDAVVGVDTHRDTHEVEIASPNGVPIARCSIRNDSTGYAQLWPGSSTTPPARGWAPRSRPAAATASGCPAR